MKITIEERKSGDAGTLQTIGRMWEIIEGNSLQWPVITTARTAIKECNPRNPRQTGDEIFRWIKQNIRFVKDTYFAELLQTPIRLLQERTGDCDCMVMLGAAMNAAIGNRTRLVTIAHLPDRPDSFSHIYYEVQISDDEWRSYDLAPPDSYPGWFPPTYFRKAAWYHDGEIEAMAGFFSKIFKEVKRAVKRVRAEARRTWRRVKKEAERTQEKINKELARWEKDLGPAGKFLILGTKVGVTILTAGTMAPILATTMAVTTGATAATGGILGATVVAGTTSAPIFQQITAVGIQVEDNPFKLTEDEWILLAKIASSIGSAVLTFVSGGSTAALLAASILQLANTAVSGVEIHENLEKRKTALKKLKSIAANYEIEKRVQREALKKLETDIAILSKIIEKQNEYNATVKAIQQQKEDELRAEEAQLRKAQDRELGAYKQKLLDEINVFVNVRAVNLRWKNFQVYKEAARIVAKKFRHTPEAEALSDWYSAKNEKVFVPYQHRYVYGNRQRYAPGEPFSAGLYPSPIYPGIANTAYFPNFPADPHVYLAQNPHMLKTIASPYKV